MSVRSMCCSRSFLKLPQNQRLCREIGDFIFHIVNIYSPSARPKKMFIAVVTYGRFLKGYRSRTLFIFLIFGVICRKNNLWSAILSSVWLLLAEMALCGGDYREVEDTEVQRWFQRGLQEKGPQPEASQQL